MRGNGDKRAAKNSPPLCISACEILCMIEIELFERYRFRMKKASEGVAIRVSLVHAGNAFIVEARDAVSNVIMYSYTQYARQGQG